ncbi:MAG TPA: glycosyltransferase family 1 protein, partial [Candidatus Bathyarchaeota archaeon]|nr:glycosyltransferase family 1 protein [Candidatus Bathyarchaeota archaeon]
IYTILQHTEIVLAPLLWSLLSNSGRPSLVICSIPLFSGLGGWLLNLLWGIPYIVYAQGEELTKALQSRTLFYTRYHLTKLVLKRAAAIVSISCFTQQILCDKYDVECNKSHIIHPSLDIKEQTAIDWHLIPTFKQDIVGKSKMILMVGRLIQIRKGFDKAIQSLPKILADIPDTKLVVVGPGDQTLLRSYAREAEVEKQVIFMGEVMREQLLMLYAACDIFLLPARTMPDGDTEGFGIVFLEANLMGKAVVGGRAGGTLDAIVDRETGLLVDGNDTEQIANAVVELLNDPTYAESLGQQGKTRVLKEFNSQFQQQKFTQVIQSILPSAGTTGK